MMLRTTMPCSSSRSWSRMPDLSTSKVGCTRACYCKSNWCPRMWMSHVVLSQRQLVLGCVVTRHFTLATGGSTADVDALFNEQILTKVIICLVSDETFIRSCQKNHVDFAHMHLNSACLVVDGRPLPAQPWQLDFEQGLYADTYHALLKSCDMYHSDWSNYLIDSQFVGISILLSWDLKLDSSNGVAYLSPRPLNTMKASLRFARSLSATITLIANDLVMIDA